MSNNTWDRRGQQGDPRKRDTSKLARGFPSTAGIRDRNMKAFLDAVKQNTDFILRKLKYMPAPDLRSKPPLVDISRLPVVKKPTAPPVIPTLTATGGVEKVTLTWSAVSGASTYNLYWSTTSGLAKASRNQITDETSGYEHTALTGGQPYYYCLTALDANGIESALSTEANATPTALPMYGSSFAIRITFDADPPVNFSFSGQTSGTVTLPDGSTQDASACDNGWAYISGEGNTICVGREANKWFMGITGWGYTAYQYIDDYISVNTTTGQITITEFTFSTVTPGGSTITVNGTV